MYVSGERVRVQRDGVPDLATVRAAVPSADMSGWTLFLLDDDGGIHEIELTASDTHTVTKIQTDGAADSARVLAGMWTRWMAQRLPMPSPAQSPQPSCVPTPIRPPPSTARCSPSRCFGSSWRTNPELGKTIMAGLYLREMQRLGLVQRAIIVCPANLTSKWVADFRRFLGGGLRHLTANTVREEAVSSHDLWVVSLELAAVNPAVQEAIRPDRAGWDLVIFDEAHRLTPTATSFHQVGRLLAKNTPRALLMTATPHRGKEWLFRHLLHLVDPAIYPDPGADPNIALPPLRPGPTHFLRRMKEDLVDYDGKTRLFKGRTARNYRVPLSTLEFGYYQAALDMVDQYFPPTSQPLARMVYGKRAASSLWSLAETLRRRAAHMGEMSEAEAALQADREHEGDESEADEAKVVHAGSTASRAERSAIKTLIDQISASVKNPTWQPSKWKRLVDSCLAKNGITPGNSNRRSSSLSTPTRLNGSPTGSAPPATPPACTPVGKTTPSETRSGWPSCAASSRSSSPPTPATKASTSKPRTS